MHFALIILFFAQLVLGAPTSGTIDSVTLLKNGKNAVALNTQWKNITAADACQGAQMACVENSIATCTSGKWGLSAGHCATGHQCFALPNTRTEGIDISCTSPKNALSLIASTGADTGDMSSSNPDQASTMTTTVTVTAQATPTDNSVVTVTVTVAPGTTTLPAQTRTLSPSDASKILSSEMATATPSSTEVTTQAPSPTDVTTQTLTFSPADASKILASMQATAGAQPTDS